MEEIWIKAIRKTIDLGINTKKERKKRKKYKYPKNIDKLPEIGQKYTWRTVSQIANDLQMDHRNLRQRIKNNNELRSLGYRVKTDNKTLYEYTGQKVWYENRPIMIYKKEEVKLIKETIAFNMNL